MKNSVLIFLLFVSIQTFAQLPGEPFNPMTAAGAKGISNTQHILFWQNPVNVLYNEIYFSSDSMLVANQDTTVRVKNGFPSTAYSNYSLSEYGSLMSTTKYFWKVVEYNSYGASISPLWYFTTFGILQFEYQCSFNTGPEGWQFFGPLGQSNWYWSNTANAGGSPGELVFRWDPIFNGDSYFMSPNLIVPWGAELELYFRFYEDWWSDTVVVGAAITYDNGSTWESIWELHATGNVGPDEVYVPFEVQDSFRLGFYYTGNSNNIDFFYVDDIAVSSILPLTPPYPPSMLVATASDEEQKVSLSWNPGWAVSGLYGYQLQRKTGDPNTNSPYITIAVTGIDTLNFEDLNVELNHIYTYRIRSLVMGFNSQYGNEATAYVPEAVPVELTSFTASVSGNDVTVNWSTASETNNQGFEVQRQSAAGNAQWETIGFVEGRGTTTEEQSYSYRDKNLSAGNYQYRLKQIDFDGTFEYSKVAEVEIGLPTRFVLEQNYPNPFNPSTKIEYNIPNAATGQTLFVTLKVYDVIGNEVTILVDEYKTAGIYEVEFDASQLSSGIYFYKLSAGSFISTKKMILMK
ncbi:MAG: T9SS type A sorting domain-containing protein [Ignavibacteriaceae bacterium]